ncbi:hypothetical protein [Desulfuribacillus alkaliarsenatis]|uniref:Core-binding (CB) domain-containing protein n=1 Tax=Desulfuribacillus alkaliarsenatis TaxID=766136 RepID=A0A1E5FZI4_9FIRM|nr:hypothetical protein [Desulfuribacillus alkaliarsenatis]OEF95974.1 hypothetical protein BHF68_09485 [Desulfuribacillus alkaliarsenatis]
MYKFYDEVQELIDELQQTYGIKKSSLVFYKGRINKFFNDYMSQEYKDKPLNAITYYDINTFINKLPFGDAEKLNHYNSLKRFFDYTYLKKLTPELMSQVTRPEYQRPPKKILSDEEYDKLRDFIVCRDNNIKERLILGLFLFTGLSRMYIGAIVNSQFIYDRGVYKLMILQEGEVVLPLKAELQLIVHEYINSLTDDDNLKKVVPYDQNYISTYIGRLTTQILGKKHNPTTLSSTFIRKALSNGNYVWEVSKLTLESIVTIEKHVINSEDIFNRQTSILNRF